MEAHTLTPHQKSSPAQDMLGPLTKAKFAPASRGIPLSSRCASPGNPCAMHRHGAGRTPPVTPPSGHPSPYSPIDHKRSSEEGSSPSVATGRGIAAPTTAVDDVMEKFGRPRAHSLSRSERHLSLPVWEEEGDESMPGVLVDDRRRAVSMSAAEEPYRRSATSQYPMLKRRCRDCYLSPSFAMEGEAPTYCRGHQMAGMVNVLMDGCDVRGCRMTGTYGFRGEGRQRCFSHKEEGMVHVLGNAIEEGSSTVTGRASAGGRLEH